jgi:hypothetical protein
VSAVAIDLTGGLDPAFEDFLAERPADPGMRDSATLWAMDEGGRIAFPRVTLDAIADDWDRPWAQLNAALADGRTFRLWERLTDVSAADADDRAAVRGAGPLVFRRLEPFRRWSLDFEGMVEASTTADQMADRAAQGSAALAFHLEAEMAQPPWLMGGLTAEAANAMNAAGGALMGGLRYEQLCRVSGWARVDGETFRISGGGMRVRRRGVRNMAGAPGHCQHSALFPSGRGFGANAFWPDADGRSSFNEAFLIDADGQRTPARLAEAPWMRRLEPAGDAIPLVFETPHGEVRIAGTTLLKTFDHRHFEMADTSVLEQGAARYVWDGEETIGLFERCTLRERIGNLSAAIKGEAN